eukprot:8849295-Alexandrium_andersonii.AAC.1
MQAGSTQQRIALSERRQIPPAAGVSHRDWATVAPDTPNRGLLHANSAIGGCPVLRTSERRPRPSAV